MAGNGVKRCVLPAGGTQGRLQASHTARDHRLHVSWHFYVLTNITLVVTTEQPLNYSQTKHVKQIYDFKDGIPVSFDHNCLHLTF